MNTNKQNNIYEFDFTNNENDYLLQYKTFGVIIWLTGLSVAGKSSIANELNKLLNQKKYLSIILDGDSIRKGLSSDLDFSENGRLENIRRVAETAKLISLSGIIPICALISPLQKYRKLAREIIGNNFIECYVDTPLEICKQRDYKKIYSSGFDFGYEAPIEPEIILNTFNMTAKQYAWKIFEYLNNNKIV